MLRRCGERTYSFGTVTVALTVAHQTTLLLITSYPALEVGHVGMLLTARQLVVPVIN
jgi:hypothetical protein